MKAPKLEKHRRFYIKTTLNYVCFIRTDIFGTLVGGCGWVTLDQESLIAGNEPNLFEPNLIKDMPKTQDHNYLNLTLRL